MKALDADLEPQLRAFAEVLRSVFFDRLKRAGMTYADISEHLGRKKFSATTLSRIAAGRKLPDYEQYFGLVGLVPALLGKPLTEKVQGHLWHLYLQAIAVKNTRLAEFYRHQRSADDLRERRHAMLVLRATASVEPADHDSDLDPHHPAVQLREEAAALLDDVARAGVPLPARSLVTPAPGEPRPPATEAMLDHTAWLLDQVDQALRTQITYLEPVVFASDTETESATPSPPTQPKAAAAPLPAPARGEGARHVHAQVWSIVLAIVLVLVAVGYLLERIPLGQRDAPPSSRHSAQASTGGQGPSQGQASETPGGDNRPRPSDQAPKTGPEKTRDSTDGGTGHTTAERSSPEESTSSSSSAPPESVITDMQVTADPGSGAVFCDSQTVTFTLSVTTSKTTTVAITWIPDSGMQERLGAQPEERTLAFPGPQTVRDTYSVNLRPGSTQQGTVTVNVTAPEGDSGRQASASFDLMCEPG
ncbi:hypothetical protein ACIP25_07295 [Streptomyces massasporeus]|uniref:hypothetical protein n=1 Tax=Streptomyces massasporeus TaxID=67324 RepID=UPI0037F44529